MKTIHSRAFRDQISTWYSEPHDSVEFRLAVFAADHTDVEIRDELITIFDEDPPDCAAVAAARKLWPLLLLTDPLHEPADLFGELDELARDMSHMRLRVEALSAKFRALEPWAERWDRYPHETPEFGDRNIFYTSLELRSATAYVEAVSRELQDARGYAAKLRDYSAEVES